MRNRKGHLPDGIGLAVKQTTACGRGVFAVKPIKAGERIFTLTGEPISYKTCARRVLRDKTLSIDDPLQIGDRLYLALDEFSRLFNHSCEPNAGFRRVSDLHALRDISAGEEICFDYAATVSPSITIDLWTMECRCAAKNCRRLLGNVLTIPPERLAMYVSQNAVQDYMMRTLNQFAKHILQGIPMSAAETAQPGPRGER